MSSPQQRGPTNDDINARLVSELRFRPHLEANDVVGGYKIEKVAGEGGMGVVYKAIRVEDGRPVALKMMKLESADRPQDVERFRREPERQARLEHPQIVKVLDGGTHDGWPYFVMEWAESGSLKGLLDHRPLECRSAAELIKILARTVGFAHECNVIHRDLKPANILFADDNSPKVSDFGLSKHLDDKTPLTLGSARMGTPRYMAPEQARGDADSVGPASDVYSLGVILYECLTGRPPFMDSSEFETLFLVINHPPVPPRRLRPTVDRKLEAVCLKCLEKEARNRYVTAHGLAEDLGRYLRGVRVEAKLKTETESLRPSLWMRLRPITRLMLRAIRLPYVLIGWLATLALRLATLVLRLAVLALLLALSVAALYLSILAGYFAGAAPHEARNLGSEGRLLLAVSQAFPVVLVGLVGVARLARQWCKSGGLARRVNGWLLIVLLVSAMAWGTGCYVGHVEPSQLPRGAVVPQELERAPPPPPE